MNGVFKKSFFCALRPMLLLDWHPHFRGATRTAVARNRMPGGVGGRRELFRLLPIAPDFAWWVLGIKSSVLERLRCLLIGADLLDRVEREV